MELQRIAAFSINRSGGNPAGVAFCAEMPAEAEMLRIAKEVGYSETAFLVPVDNGWRVRYFAPAQEVPFCGHATIASGAALGARYGEGTYSLTLNAGSVTVEAIQSEDGSWSAALQSPETWSRAAPDSVVNPVLKAFQLTSTNLDVLFPVRIASAGATHLLICLKERETLAAMQYPFDTVKALMAKADLTTISLLWCETPTRFHARNPFAVGGVYEDPATGAAAAALGGYLRDIGWTDSEEVEILQGNDMGQPSRLIVNFSPTPGASVRVAGNTHIIDNA